MKETIDKRLSELLTTGRKFHFVTAVAHLEPFSLRALENVIDEMLSYTQLLAVAMDRLAVLDAQMTIDWLIEGKDKFYEVYRNVDSIDSVILQALNLLETNLKQEDIGGGDTRVFDKLDTLSECSLRVKGGYIVRLKSRIDVSVEYNDIYTLMMNSINTELEYCLKKCFKIHEKRFSSPVRHAPSFNLELLTRKLLQSRTQLKLPLLNEIDNELYEEYLELKTIVDPLRASLNFIPMRIEDFKSKYGDAADTKSIEEKYHSLMKDMQFLQNEVNDLKYELIDKRWSEIFSYLNTELSFLMTNVEREISKSENLEESSVFKSQVYKRLKYTVDIVENTFVLINRAIDEELIDIRTMERCNELAEQWLELKIKIPQDYLDKMETEDGMDNTDSDEMTNNFKKLSLDSRKTSDTNDKRITSDHEKTKKEKRRSVYGQFLFDKMNIQAVMIEGDPTSAKKPEDANKVLSNSAKVNQIETKVSTGIPDLKQNIPRLSPDDFISDTLDAQSPSIRRHGPFERLSPIIDNTPRLKDSHSKTLEKLMGHDSPPDQFELETPIRRGIPAQKPQIIEKPTVMEKSKIPLPANNVFYQSRIPRPVSSISTVRGSNPSGVKSIEGSFQRVGSRLGQRAQTSMSHTRTSDSFGLDQQTKSSFRNSVIPQTPIRSSRKSLIPQPTPIREIIEYNSTSRMGARSSHSNSRAKASSSLGTRYELSRPQWR